jgi:hypothetical protein
MSGDNQSPVCVRLVAVPHVEQEAAAGLKHAEGFPKALTLSEKNITLN